jgi:hypothetical protein
MLKIRAHAPWEGALPPKLERKIPNTTYLSTTDTNPLDQSLCCVRNKTDISQGSSDCETNDEASRIETKQRGCRKTLD